MPVPIHKSQPDVLDLFILGCSINVTTGYADCKICQNTLQKSLLFFLHCLLQWSQINPFACTDMKSVPGILLDDGEGRNRGGFHCRFQINHSQCKIQWPWLKHDTTANQGSYTHCVNKSWTGVTNNNNNNEK